MKTTSTHHRCAVYGRRSTDDAHTEINRSVTRQVAHAKQYAQRKGWSVLDEHVYTDDGISGGEFKNRPGLLRLLNALKPAPQFDAVIMMEASRLGRDRLSTELVARDLFESGVKIYYYLDDTEERLDTPEHRFVMAARGFAAATTATAAPRCAPTPGWKRSRPWITDCSKRSSAPS